MIRNKIILTFLLSVLLGKGIICAQNMMHFTSEEFEYSIQIPEEWKRSNEISDQVALVMLSNEGASVSISFYKLNSQTADQFIERYEKSLDGNFNDLVVEEKGVIKSRDDDALYLVYSFKKDGQAKREKVCFYSRDAEIALVVVNNSEAAYHNDVAAFNMIFKSFTFQTIQDRVEEVD